MQKCLQVHSPLLTAHKISNANAFEILKICPNVILRENIPVLFREVNKNMYLEQV